MLRKILLTALCLAAFFRTPAQESAPRMEWDESSLTCIFPAGNYGRMRELSDGTFAAVAGGREGTLFSRSADGKTWSEPVVIAPNTPEVTMSVPEITELSDGSILVGYNPRVRRDASPDARYGIRVRKSADRGTTWGPEIFVFDAGHTERTGCWEPAMLQLPSGEVLLFFANEADYGPSREQNISVCRSSDMGLTWSEPEIVSFRAKHRDGMPVPVYIPESDEIIVAIEDNGWPGHERRMQPSMIRIPLGGGWPAGYVDAESPLREYALAEELPSGDNAAAPYICRLPTGEVLLSYQGTEGRETETENGVKNIERCQRMIVAVGDTEGRDFGHRIIPFDIPPGPDGVWSLKDGYYCHWNSLCATRSGEVWAVASTNAFGGGAYTGIWAIKGRLKR